MLCQVPTPHFWKGQHCDTDAGDDEDGNVSGGGDVNANTHANADVDADANANRKRDAGGEADIWDQYCGNISMLVHNVTNCFKCRRTKRVCLCSMNVVGG